jgi:hypothetical protein
MKNADFQADFVESIIQMRYNTRNTFKIKRTPDSGEPAVRYANWNSFTEEQRNYERTVS